MPGEDCAEWTRETAAGRGVTRGSKRVLLSACTDVIYLCTDSYVFIFIVIHRCICMHIKPTFMRAEVAVNDDSAPLPRGWVEVQLGGVTRWTTERSGAVSGNRPVNGHSRR